jgi:hypothetical protein
MSCLGPAVKSGINPVRLLIAPFPRVSYFAPMIEENRMMRLAVLALILSGLTFPGCTFYRAGNDAHRQTMASAEEVATIESLKAIAAAQQSYYTTRKSYGTFNQLVNTKLLDERFASDKPVVNGYTYTITISGGADDGSSRYAINADPHQAEGESKINKRHFYIDSQTKQVHAHTGRPASSQDPLAN